MEYKLIQTTVEKIVRMLVNAEYEDLYKFDKYKDCTPNEIEVAINDWGNMTLPPTEAFERIDVYETDDANHVRIDFDLWFDNNISDLTLKCSIYKSTDFEESFAIEGIRML